MDEARTLPQQHVSAGLLLDVAAQVTVGRPDDLLAARVQIGNDFQPDRRRHHPVRARLHRRAGVRIDDHRAIRMRVAERGEFVGGTTEIERTGGVEIRHQDAFVRAQNLRGLTHETHAGHDQRLRVMIAAETRHLQRIRDAAAGFVSEFLQLGVHIIVRDKHRLFTREQRADARLQRDFLFRRRHVGHLRPCLTDAAGQTLRLRPVVFDAPDRLIHDPLCPAALPPCTFQRPKTQNPANAGFCDVPKF